MDCHEEDGLGTNFHNGAVSVTWSASNSGSAHLGCGIEGPAEYSMTRSVLKKSTLSATAGAKIDAVFNLGITWGQETSETVTEQMSVTFGSHIHFDDTFFWRFLDVRVHYHDTPQRTCPGVEAVDVTFTQQGMSFQTKMTRKTCECPGGE